MCTGKPQVTHQALDGAASHIKAFALELRSCLARSVDSIVACGMDGLDLRFQLLPAQLARGGRPLSGLVVRRRGDRQHFADWLDLEALLVLLGVDD